MKHVKFLFLAIMVFAAAFVSSASPALAGLGNKDGSEAILVGDGAFDVGGGLD
jgi:hypothetical protein